MTVYLKILNAFTFHVTFTLHTHLVPLWHSSVKYLWGSARNTKWRKIKTLLSSWLPACSVQVLRQSGATEGLSGQSPQSGKPGEGHRGPGEAAGWSQKPTRQERLCVCNQNQEEQMIPPGLPQGLSGKDSTCSARDPGSIPGSGRSPGGRHGNPFQYSCLENPMDRGAWQL